ncbi:hypothetical protein ABXV15_14305 [Exiguobacterium profundum]|uniref:hypothetical protein n=1 Tax=Exiguobacterium profundum TaxID=307643 RepID=UPI0033964B99
MNFPDEREKQKLEDEISSFILEYTTCYLGGSDSEGTLREFVETHSIWTFDHTDVLNRVYNQSLELESKDLKNQLLSDLVNYPLYKWEKDYISLFDSYAYVDFEFLFSALEKEEYRELYKRNSLTPKAATSRLLILNFFYHINKRKSYLIKEQEKSQIIEVNKHEIVNEGTEYSSDNSEYNYWMDVHEGEVDVNRGYYISELPEPDMTYLDLCHHISSSSYLLIPYLDACLASPFINAYEKKELISEIENTFKDLLSTDEMNVLISLQQ